MSRCLEERRGGGAWGGVRVFGSCCDAPALSMCHPKIDAVERCTTRCEREMLIFSHSSA